MEVLIIGGGIGGLTLALTLHKVGVSARVYEAAPEIKPIGVGINVLPHATKVLDALGLESALAKVAVTTRESVFFNRFGQLIYREPAGRYAGDQWPQFSIHRGDLQDVLLQAVRERLGPERVVAGWKCTHVEQAAAGVTAHFQDPATGDRLPPQRGSIAIACDGLHSAIRRQLHPDEGAPLYSGVNMWRGVTRWPRFLSGASMVRAGWLANGKMVIYPIRNDIDPDGRQLINWVAEIETAKHTARDWSRGGDIDDFIGAFADWHFDWLDVPALIRAADAILEFPMIDQDPLSWWSRGRVSLLGDAAHPMVPRGSNGAGQAILDAHALAQSVVENADPVAALKAYEARRLGATANVVRMNRANPPDAILREVYLRTGDKPFARVEDVISEAELRAISDRYKRVAGYDAQSLWGNASEFDGPAQSS
jgi:2-polyprenyl-6-methoxyphenol hydroxylase-like FAD-dependent oxidoreductase